MQVAALTKEMSIKDAQAEQLLNDVSRKIAELRAVQNSVVAEVRTRSACLPCARSCCVLIVPHSLLSQRRQLRLMYNSAVSSIRGAAHSKLRAIKAAMKEMPA
jgi:hypothetical protein